MQSSVHDKSIKGAVREVVNMAWPIMLGAVSYSLMDFADRIFVSRYGDQQGLGKEYLAAIGSSGVWSYALGVFFLSVAACVSTFVAQSFGRRDKLACGKYTWQGFYIAIIGGAISTAIVVPLAHPLFNLMNHDAAVTELEIVYFQIRGFGFAFIAWQSAISGFFQSTSRPKTPMIVAICANLTNIVLDYLLVFGAFGFPELGIGGAAVATISSLAMQAMILHIIFLSRPNEAEYGSRSGWRFDRTKIMEVFRIGWPSGVSGVLDVTNWAIFTSFIVGGFATAQLAGHNAAIAFMHLMFIPIMGLNFAATAITGQWVGRGNIPLAKQRAYAGVGIGMVIMLVLGCTFAWFGKECVGVFTKDPVAVEVGATLLILAAIFVGFDAISIVLVGALRGVGDTRWIMTVLTTMSYVVNLPLAFAFSRVGNLEAKGAWIGATIGLIIQSGVILWRFHSEGWRGIKIFSDSAPAEPAVE